MLAVVGATVDFLLRTEGVAPISAAIVLWAIRGASGRPMRVVLGALAVYSPITAGDAYDRDTEATSYDESASGLFGSSWSFSGLSRPAVP